MDDLSTQAEKKTNLLPVYAGVAILIVVVLGVIMMKGSVIGKDTVVNNDANANTPPDVLKEVNTESGSGDAMGVSDFVKTVSIEGGSFYFKPNEIRVKKGETVKITLSSVDMMHDFVIDELNVKSPIAKSGETSTVEFVANEVGTFEYYCSVGQHRSMGQVGKLIVEE